MLGQALVDLDPLLDARRQRCLLSIHVEANRRERLIIEHGGLLYGAVINPSPREVLQPLNWRNDGFFCTLIYLLVHVLRILELRRRSL